MMPEEALAKATPRPWTLSEDSCAECRRTGEQEFIINEVGRGYHGHFASEADSTLIVLAVNAYERDQETIKALVEALEGILTASQEGDMLCLNCLHWQAEHEGSCDAPRCECGAYESASERARAALAQARGEEKRT